jgi:Na+/proline symporter
VALGSGIFLVVVGAILAFAVDVKLSGLDLQVVGWICMIAGAFAIVLSLVMNAQRANTSHTEVVERRDVGNPPPGF